MQLFGMFFLFFYEKGHFSVIQYVKDHAHIHKIVLFDLVNIVYSYLTITLPSCPVRV